MPYKYTVGELSRDTNVGKEWSEMDIADLRSWAATGKPLTGKDSAARFLMRADYEVRKKAPELGLTPVPKNRRLKRTT
jgi:hypothetical protein